MKKWLQRNRSYFLGIVFGVALSPAIFFWTPLLNWIDANEHLAAWVQAIGSIFAIALALALWRGDRTRENNEKKSRARALTYRLAPALADIEIAMSGAFLVLEHMRKHIGIVKLDIVILAARKGLFFPPILEPTIYGEFHSLRPELAWRLSHLFYTVEHHNRRLNTLLELLENAPEMLAELISKEQISLDTIGADLTALKPIFATEASKLSSFFRPTAENSQR